MRRLLLLAARAAFTAYCLATAIYCLLAYLPFTYHQVLACRLIPALNRYAEAHRWVNLAAVCLVAMLLRESLQESWRKRGWTLWMAAGLGVCQIAMGLALLVHPVLPGLKDGWVSLAWSFGYLAFPSWLAAVDIGRSAGRIAWTDPPPGTNSPHFGAAWRGAIFVVLLYTGVSLTLSPARPAVIDLAPALGWSLLAHLLIFLALFLVLDWAKRIAGLFRSPAQVEFWLCHGVLAVAVYQVLQTVLCPAIGFGGWQAKVFAAAFGLSLAVQNAVAALEIAGDRTVEDGLMLAMSPVTFGATRSALANVGTLSIVALGGWFLAVKSAAMDWDFLVQELTAAGVWLLGFAFCYGRSRRAPARGMARGIVWIALPLALTGAWRGLAAVPQSGPALERWAGHNASFRLARVFLTPPAGDGSFYRFLASNTNIAASVHVDPVPVVLADNLTKSSGPLPNIFIITIDSLRRDYLSPYNPAVSFTPSIDAFARDSTVFRNAFTRYGGTGLSEPAIWSGSLQLHKQYVTPYAPMNALEKLLRAEQYRVMVSRDSILASILTPAPDDVELDLPDSVRTHDLIRTLATLEEEIGRRAADSRPLFAYTQPQNIHIAVIQREGATVPAGESWPGFYAPYASRLRRLDEAFGRFLEFLKAHGQYDRSIIVLTSDHGDSLGENGRWGHAYTLFPEIVRIPLIVHLPPEWRSRLGSDPQAAVFNTDITPSLYYLLGHRPVRQSELFGRPLFTETSEERARDPRAWYLLAASYGAVYGILSDNGRRLYVADGVNYRKYRFDLGAPSSEGREPAVSDQREQDGRIRDAILAINRFYRFGEVGKP